MSIVKKMFFVILVIFTCAIAQAETVYVSCTSDIGKACWIKHGSYGEYGARILSMWEKNNSDKKILSTAVHLTGDAGEFYGFWITYELKK